MLASADRSRSRGDVVLARRARVRKHRVRFSVPRRLRPGAWFLVVCTLGRRRRCGASKRPLIRTPNRLGKGASAHPSLERDRAASAVIGAAGGSLSASAADGTGFTLEVEAGSVPDGTTITMTPLSSVTHASWAGKLAGGVQLEPEGLALLHGGTLTVVPRHRLPVSRQVAFGYTGGGAGLHEVTLAKSRKRIEIPLAHFSGAGVGSAGPGAGSPPAPSSDAAFYEQLMAGVTDAYRRGDIGGDEWEEACASILEEQLRDIVAEEVPPGLGDDAAADVAIRDLLGYARAFALTTGQEDDPFNRVYPTVLKLEEGKYERAQKRCAENHDLTELLNIYRIDRNWQLLGQPEKSTDEDLRCQRYRVEFKSEIDVHAGEGASGEWNLEYAAKVPVRPSAASGYQIVEGSGTGVFEKAQGAIVGDEGTSGTVLGGTGDAFDVARFEDAGLVSPGKAITVALTLNHPTERYHAHDPEGADYDYEDNIWQSIFEGVFHPEAVQYGLVALPLERGSGDVVAKGSWTNATPDGGATERTTVEVVHTPG